MKIFILRHGEAEPYRTDDASRRLTQKGINDTQHIINANFDSLSSINTIYASPLVRAQQTAAIAGKLLKQQIVTMESLEPEANPDEVFAVLQTITEEKILLVSHLPLVGILANRLCGLPLNALRFNTSSLVGIECEIPASGMGSVFFEKHI
jgi:phosphohistidine phosphatase